MHARADHPNSQKLQFQYVANRASGASPQALRTMRLAVQDNMHAREWLSWLQQLKEALGRSARGEQPAAAVTGGMGGGAAGASSVKAAQEGLLHKQFADPVRATSLPAHPCTRGRCWECFPWPIPKCAHGLAPLTWQETGLASWVQFYFCLQEDVSNGLWALSFADTGSAVGGHPETIPAAEIKEVRYCLSLTFHCLFTAFPCLFNRSGLGSTARPLKPTPLPRPSASGSPVSCSSQR